MEENFTDPSGPMTLIDQQILLLKKLLRPAGNPDTKAIIDACQSMKAELSYIEDWAFQKGKQNE